MDDLQKLARKYIVSHDAKLTHYLNFFGQMGQLQLGLQFDLFDGYRCIGFDLCGPEHFSTRSLIDETVNLVLGRDSTVRMMLCMHIDVGLTVHLYYVFL